MQKYDFRKIERKWQKKWEEDGIYRAKDFSPKKKFYCLIEFPYPSGAGLHAGHVRSHVAIDIVARKRRMQGENVLYPIGWDAFGLPTENFAIKTKKHPETVTRQNIRNFKRQIQSYGPSFDWSREINTTDPTYYKWTQWIFLKLYGSYYDEEQDRARPIEKLSVPPILNEAETRRFIDERRLAYEKAMPINWCPSCKIGLANEEVVGGNCERCGAAVEKKHLKQWMLRITKYADRLIRDLDTVDYLDKIKTQQVNWIGKSVGAEVDFEIRSAKGEPGSLKVFTTRPDTLFGCTYMVIAPEHPLVEKLKPHLQNPAAVKKYVASAAHKSDLKRTELSKTKTGVELKGVWAINPATGKKIPVWMADYVLMSYGTGAIMAVPAHDERDFEFALKFDLPIVPVIKPQGEQEVSEECYTGDGTLTNSNFLNGLTVNAAKTKMIKFLEKNHAGKAAVNFKLRDWVFSRQHYWGEPIPIIKCKRCGNVPLGEKDLPLKLPKVKNYEPTDTGESPLASIVKWTKVPCPKCGEAAERETDTMPNWAGSSWYFLRYLDPRNTTAFAARKKINHWMPVDLYNGGMEHTTLHLLYSRFWHKFLFDLGLVSTAEPYAARRSQGMVIAEDGQKMSKSKGNVINPDQLIREFGADTLRLYEMFMGPYAEAIPWSTQSFVGSHRFLERVWHMQTKIRDAKTPLLIATANAGKVKEIKAHLRGLKGFKLITLADLETKIPEPKETGKTFAANSLQKAKYYAERTGYLTLSDDSGLSIAAMPKDLGVRSSRFARGNYPAAMRKILDKLEGFEEKERAAEFGDVVTLYHPQSKTFTQYTGEAPGIIAEAVRGKAGFGYDPIFIPRGTTRTFGEMSAKEKSAWDHRGKAFAKLRADLEAEKLKTEKAQIVLHQTIQKVSSDIEELKFNTAVAQLMTLANHLEELKFIPRTYFEKFILLLAPFVPHLAEELWQNLGNRTTIHLHAWPTPEEKFLISQTVELVVQVNGKLRDKLTVDRNISAAEAESLALASPKIQKWLENQTPRKVIFVPEKLINIVT